MYKKNILPHPVFYLSCFTKSTSLPYLVFIHGGPGLNCGVLEHLIEHNQLFSSLKYNIIFYDQRNCGKSLQNKGQVSHQDNINDLKSLISYITEHLNLKIAALIGHSYGAKLLFDYYQTTEASLPAIFVSTAKCILTPRLNNLMLDLGYLKKNNHDLYEKAYSRIDRMDIQTLWKISEELAPIFQQNKERSYLYWANMEYSSLVHTIQEKINLPINEKVFSSVRRDLYANEANVNVAIHTLKIRKLWVNGFHDFVMNGHDLTLHENHEITTFYKSSHYPHIEENERFCAVLNAFI